LIHSGIDSLGTVRGRAGLVVGTTLAYATAGFAWGRVNNHWGAGYANAAALNCGPVPCGPITDSNFFQGRTQVGWAAGFGIEHIFASMPRLMFRMEAMWVDLGKSIAVNNGPSFVNAQPGPYYSEFQNQALLARAGVSYKIW
jgi:opacity protein-like surface antigen